LAKLDIIKDEKTAVMSARQKLLSKTNRDLDQALETSENDEKIAECLQIFANLRVLTNFLDNTMLENFLNDIKHVLKECFAGADVAGLQKNSQKKAASKNASERKGPGKTPTLTTSQHFRQKLWAALDWIFADYIFGYCKLSLRLSQCLAKVVENLGEKSEIATDFHTIFWGRLQNLLQTSFMSTAPVHIQQCFQQQLPKLLAAAKVLAQKLDHQFEFSDNLFEALEVGYLEKCGSNLKAALLNVDHPEKENIDALMRAAALELSASIVDKRLCRLVVGAFKACNQDFWTKIESQVKIGTDSAQVYDVANAAQIQNTNLCNLIYYHEECVRRMVDNLGVSFSTSESAEAILSHLKTGQNLVLVVLQQLFDSIASAVNIILLTMHREPGLDGNSSSNHDLSLYMRELQDFLNRSWNSHINPFADKGAVEKCARELAARCVELFVQNVCILRPLSEAGRERIKNDCLRLESALRPINLDLSSLGKCYRMLRALASLVTETPEILVAQTNERGGAIPHYCVLLLLFGHATSTDLLSPHTAAGWNNEKLIQWLGGHTSDTERFELVEGALQRYRTTIRQKKLAKYDPVYPLISNLLDTAKEQIN
jgi:conserved oligomeric Golgi complex subunit 5